MVRHAAIWLLCVVILFAVTAHAEDTPASTQFRFGVQDSSVLTVNVFAFQPLNTGQTVARPFSGTYHRFSPSHPCCLVAPIHLPSGAVVTRFEIVGCDMSNQSSMSATLNKLDQFGVRTPVADVVTEAGVSPGCGAFGADGDVVIDNSSGSYFIEFDQDQDTAGNIRLSAARVYYRLQVSPPPAQPTFGDVPTTHPFYQFIEALAASGITAGCANGLFCPNDPLTRGQMAVFLARALGLHWTP